ncbi:hypothetical protein CLV89_13114 [Tritonibacter scottomollicae]|uniref:Uncharacterized protein n=1 Tax=Tritonibacter scottomollicae TaxID=483013 RepID=A0A2T1A2T6_TRISK|nr:hypothetical protein CLV89_13114 [Tritonibacter scottomollicae]
MGSKWTCGGAAAGSQRFRTSSQTLDGGSQPNHDIHARRSEGTAACAKGFLKADLQICSVGPGDVAPGFKVSEARTATFAKFSYLATEWRPDAACALERAHQRKPLSVHIRGIQNVLLA